METKRFNAYNSTRGTVLNAKLAVADRELEPLKFLELLIGGLGLDSESGVWLKPLAGAPQVPRVFPFDLVYLDKNQKVIQAAEVFPGGEFPPFSDEVFSALVLPLSAVSTTQTRPGDQLLVRSQEELSEQTQETPQLASDAPQQTLEAVLQPAEFPQQPLEVPLQIQEVVPQPAEPPQLALELTPKPPGAALQPADLSQRSPDVPLQIQEVVPESTEAPQKPLELTPQLPEVVLQPAELSQQTSDVALEAPQNVLQSPETSLASQEVSLQTSPAAGGPNSQLSESTPSSPSSASAAQSLELPLEGFGAPSSAATESNAEDGKTALEPEDHARIPATPPLPVSADSAPQVSSSLDAVERKPRKAPGTTVSTPGSTIQSMGFTVGQYRSWQVSNFTAPTPALKGKKSPIQKPETEDSSNPPQAVSKADAREKPARTTHSAQSIFQPSPPPELPPLREAKNAQKPSLPDRVATPRKNLLLDTVKAPLVPSALPLAPITKTRKSTDNEPLTAVGSQSAAPDTSAKLQEPPLPLWKASPGPVNQSSASAKPSAASQGRQETAEQPQRAMAAAPSGESTNRVEKQKPPIQKVTGKPTAKLVVEQLSHSASLPRMSTTLARLMTALHRIGGGQETQSPAGKKGPAANQVSSWLNPEALHRDRRRAVRRTVPGLVAFYFTGGAPQPYTVADISATGFFLLTRDQWMPETMIQMTLQKPVADRKQRRESITVLTRIVRRAGDGIGAEFVMPESLDPNSREIKPGRATDRMALARFLFSEDFSDSFEALGCFITPPVEQLPGV